MKPSPWVERVEVSTTKTHQSRPSNAQPGTPEDAALLAYGRLFGWAVGSMLQSGKSTAPRKARKSLIPLLNDRQAASAAAAATGMGKSALANLPNYIEACETESEIVRARVDKKRESLAILWSAWDRMKERAMMKKDAKQSLVDKQASLKADIAKGLRRLSILAARKARLEAQKAAGEATICMGGKNLFHAQHHLEENGYADHLDWLADWDIARSSNILMMGGRGETAKNQIAQATEHPDGTFDLAITMPPSLVAAHGKKVVLLGLRFVDRRSRKRLNKDKRRSKGTPKDHGQRLLREALSAPQGKDGQAVSWRLTRDKKGWVCSFTAKEPKSRKQTSRLAGSLGVDVNADHLAVSCVDAQGNATETWNIPLDLSGLSSDQAKDAIEKAVISIAREAVKRGLPVAHEALDFAKKKMSLAGKSKQYRIMLSAFATKKILTAIDRACEGLGSDVWAINPAYTSVIGKHNHAGRKNMTVHQGAAVAIARRSLGCSEHPSKKALAAHAAKRPRGLKVSQAQAMPAVPDGIGFWRALSGARPGAKRGHARSDAWQADPSSAPSQARSVHARPGEIQSPGLKARPESATDLFGL
jgi:IS605 OrfB family transposase